MPICLRKELSEENLYLVVTTLLSKKNRPSYLLVALSQSYVFLRPDTFFYFSRHTDDNKNADARDGLHY